MSHSKKWDFEANGKEENSENSEIVRLGKNRIKKPNKYREILAEEEFSREINEILDNPGGQD